MLFILIYPPVNGQIQLQEQQCGGHIDSETLQTVGYIDRFNQGTGSPKGFICPLGQICQVLEPCFLFT